MKGFRTKYKELPDEKLMALATKGDKLAFDEIYNRYSTKLFYYIFRLVNRDRDKAQDFLHDLFLKVIEKPYLYDPERRFSTWIYTVATNMCRNEFRRSQRYQIVEFDEAFDNTAGDGISIPDIIDLKAFMGQLTEELNCIKPQHKITFILRYQQQLSIKEISAITDASQGTVKSRIFYTLKHLSNKLKNYNPKIKGNGYEKHIS